MLEIAVGWNMKYIYIYMYKIIRLKLYPCERISLPVQAMAHMLLSIKEKKFRRLLSQQKKVASARCKTPKSAL